MASGLTAIGVRLFGGIKLHTRSCASAKFCSYRRVSGKSRLWRGRLWLQRENQAAE